ncbi:hypothetical protein [Massilia timonae]|uniref:Uncharacterized protein n=1 Tax=Massilia timonae TaxID=47229 RepID=A0A1S2NAL0_9BURK|nr:hypothetical protein [Massilia timonae]OIJ42131.1 hypothetical protein LO55_2461 [Massilia timonae]
MNVARLMEDLVSSLQAQPDKVRPNYFDASLTLACNLITNTNSGDLSDANLIAYLDQDFLKLLLGRRFGISPLGHDIPLLLQGLHYLRAKNSSQLHGDVINACLLDFYRAALPLGEWDDVLVEDGQPRHTTARKLLAYIRPDTRSQLHSQQDRNVWLIRHGFQELPLYRSRLRHYFAEAVGYKNFQLQSGDIGYAFQQISSSTPPKDHDLFHHDLSFKRWICIRGAMLMYKKKPFESRIHDLRWLNQSTTLALRSVYLGNEGRVSLSLAALGGTGNFKVTVHSATDDQQRIINFDNVSALLCEFRIQKWVDTVRITIESSGNYVADLGTT